ncbi:MAG TPA: dihydrofolate reductase family protein, partial [Hyphomicrobiaceae bacterium]|nr:dihydrofolate reductase family protein [Hyphomicrobiaceae bacterium]
LETGVDDGLPSVLAALARNGVTRILVEGGPRLWQEFFDAGLVDEVVVMVAPLRIEGASRPILDRDPEVYFSALGFRLAERRVAAADRILTFRRETT